MKLSLPLFTTVLALTSASVAQNVAVGSPADGTSVPAGSNMTVRIDRPDSLSASEEVAVVMGLWSCGANPCPGPANVMGTILYNGPFNPQFSTPQNALPPHQNFTVAIPASFPKGPAQLGVAHVALIGAGLAPFMQTLNQTIVIA
ncbi:hypothetical protein BDP27DRAFT_1382179 [Rhodocollybia butyracea]|uniref:Uncharacterized protein n=1 Tax=Rhodocollybia butyracea TaxID=206335 RepID=A0A9P5UAS5_9AGAR|nr:hypothetical protein BDP27DRAFT_1382179 [Rhodocollybia butyracea]